MIKLAQDWKDYEIIATGDGEKLERWGKLIMLRPDPQVIWRAAHDLSKYKGINAVYKRSSSGGGQWSFTENVPDNFIISRGELKFNCKLMGFKHTGLFPEQAVNWDKMSDLIKSSNRKVKVLNLFAYTGGATVACAKAGAIVTHIDSAKAMVDRAKTNCKLSAVPETNTRFIVEDCVRFVEREIRRGNVYDAIIMDPPSYGRGPSGEVWKIEDSLFDLVKLTKQIVSPRPLFYLINSYTTGLQATVIENILRINLGGAYNFESYEVGLPTNEGIALPCGCSGLAIAKNI